MDRDNILIGAKVCIYFDDGTSITRKDGSVVAIFDNFIVFKEYNLTQLIPFSRIIRIVEKNHNGGT